jgi:cell division protein FtsQ
MKIGSKRGAAAGAGVLEAPEDDSPYEAETRRRPSRRSAAAAEEDDDLERYDEPAFQRQTGAYRVRMRRGLPKSWVGRGMFAAGVVAVVGVLFAGAAGLRSALLHDSRFVITTSSDIQIAGNDNVTRAAVLRVFGADLERNIFRVPLTERRADLERLPWVAHATVMRLLPHQLRIAITERTPVAFVRQGSQIGLVDANGVLLDMPADAAGDPHYSFPVLTGLSESDPLSTRAARMAIYQRFMETLDSTGEGLSKSLSEVDVSDPEDVKAVVASGGSDILVHFGDEQFLERYHEFEQHLAEWKQQYPRLASADMRYERQVVLEMQPGTGVPGVGTPVTTAAAGAATGAQSAGLRPTGAQPAGLRPTRSDEGNVTQAAAMSNHLKAKATRPVSGNVTAQGKAGRTSRGNGKIFAELAAAHRAQLKAQQRKKAGSGSHSVAGGAGAR